MILPDLKASSSSHTNAIYFSFLDRHRQNLHNPTKVSFNFFFSFQLFSDIFRLFYWSHWVHAGALLYKSIDRQHTTMQRLQDDFCDGSSLVFGKEIFLYNFRFFYSINIHTYTNIYTHPHIYIYIYVYICRCQMWPLDSFIIL